ncbi:MAG: DUF971 domain-containing protein [Anaerolineaceae bacterium]|nr:DUF971 domain-containing protein [Anaerolineaceae bacterium]
MQSLSPTKIDAKKAERILVVEWNDGHASAFPFGLLRAGCPCVECRGGHDKMRSDPEPSVFNQELPESSATNLADLSLVGSYGLNIQWNDGHHHGIYQWDYLRKLCPCEQCRFEKQK